MSNQNQTSETLRVEAKSIAELAITARVQMATETEDGAQWFKFKYRAEAWSPPMLEDEAREYLTNTGRWA